MPTIAPGWLVALGISGTISILLPVAAIVVRARSRGRATLRPVLAGAAIFILSQVVLRLPLVALGDALTADARAASPALQWAWLFVLALTAGLFEETGRYVGYKTWLRERHTRSDAIEYGLGHGGIEAILIGGLGSLATLVGLLVLTPAVFAALPAESRDASTAQLQAFATQPAWMPLLGCLERALAMTAHVALSLIVLRASIARSFRFVVLAITLHGALDFCAIAVVQTMGTGPLGAGLAEAAVAVMAVAMLALALRVAPADVDQH